MIIHLGFYKRKPGISAAEFRHLWTEVYGALNGRHIELSRHLRRYVQHVLTPAPGTPPELQFDGFSEAWFDSQNDADALRAEPIFQDRIAPFAGEFLDLTGSTFSAYDSQVYQVGAAPPLSAPFGDRLC